MTQEVDELKAAVTEEHTVIDGAITLLDGLSARITALAQDPVALRALAAEIGAKKTVLADALVRNTPAAAPA